MAAQLTEAAVTGKQLVPDDPNYRRAFQKREPSFSERVGDGLEGYFTGATKGRFWTELLASAAKGFVGCWLILAFLLAFHPVVGFIGPFRPRLPQWIGQGGGTDAALFSAIFGYAFTVFGFWKWFLILYIPWLSLRAYALAKEALPRHFKERSERRAAAAREREHIRREYEAGLARQLGAAETAKRAREQAEANRLEAEKRERQAQIEAYRAYARTRAEVREGVQRRVLAAVARARLDALVKGDPDPTETACQRVRGAMQRERPMPPDWGLLRDREMSDPTIKSLIGDGQWLPEAPPYPAGFSTGLLN